MMSMKKGFFLFCLVASALSPALSYGTSHFGQMIESSKPVLSLGAGAIVASDLGGSQNFPFNQPIIDTRFDYSSNNKRQVEPILDIFLGRECTISPKWALQLGLGYNQTVPFEANGTFTQSILPVLSQINWNYEYNIRARQLLVESKLQYHVADRYHPYVFAGLGAGFNTASNYRAYVLLPNITRQYRDSTTESFSYSVGLGLDVDVIERVRLGIGYRFADYGKAELGQANILGHNVAGTLSQAHLYTNTILTQLTFLLS